jgi:hypothetical protein
VTYETFPKRCPVLPGQMSCSSLIKKDEFLYRDKGVKALPEGEMKIKFKL